MSSDKHLHSWVNWGNVGWIESPTFLPQRHRTPQCGVCVGVGCGWGCGWDDAIPSTMMMMMMVNAIVIIIIIIITTIRLWRLNPHIVYTIWSELLPGSPDVSPMGYKDNVIPTANITPAGRKAKGANRWEHTWYTWTALFARMNRDIARFAYAIEEWRQSNHFTPLLYVSCTYDDMCRFMWLSPNNEACRFSVALSILWSTNGNTVVFHFLLWYVPRWNYTYN